MLYENYNREERNLCSHLFRLLHEPQNGHSALRQFLGRDCDGGRVKIYSEVALIRDAYHVRKPHVSSFMSRLVQLVAKQHSLEDHTPFCDIPDELKDPWRTHPKDLGGKFLKRHGSYLKKDDRQLYGLIQAYFGAKPDLAVCLENEIVVYEAKFTESFNEHQIRRAALIAEVWAELLYCDLGYQSPPDVTVKRLGLEKYSPEISWEKVAVVAHEILGAEDKTSKALKLAVVNN